MPNPITMYEYEVTCNTCGKTELYTLLSVNPDKTHLTFKAANPLTGYANLPSVHPLRCGHKQDLEGTPVKRHRASKQGE